MPNRIEQTNKRSNEKHLYLNLSNLQLFCGIVKDSISFSIGIVLVFSTSGMSVHDINLKRRRLNSQLLHEKIRSNGI